MFLDKRSPSSTALAAIGSSSWGTPLRTMRLLLASSSMMTVLAGMTLPQTTTFNVLLSVEEFACYRYDKGALGTRRLWS